MKRYLFCFLTLMFFGIEASNARANEKNEFRFLLDTEAAPSTYTDSQGLIYSFVNSSSSYSVTGFNDNIPSKVVIPETVNGYPVTLVGEGAFSECTTLTSISLPSSLKSIEEGAFAGTSSLTSIDIPQGVTNIGDWAFSGSAISSVTIPERIEILKRRVFDNCQNLESVSFPTTLKTIEEYAFAGCSSIIAIELPHNIVEIGKESFRDCYALKSVIIPESIKIIGEGAFMNSNLIESVSIMNSNPLDIEWDTFNSSNAILYVPKDAILAYSVSAYWQDFKDIWEVGKEYTGPRVYADGEIRTDGTFTWPVSEGIKMTFKVLDYVGKKVQVGKGKDRAPSIDCSFEGNLVIPSIVNGYAVTKVGRDAFRECQISSISFPESITEIEGTFLFEHCYRLNNVVLPVPMQGYGHCMFKGCSNLNNLTTTSGKDVGIDSYAFEGTAFESFVIPDGVNSITHHSFSYCEHLKSIVIPSSVINILGDAFVGCGNLKSVISLNETPTEIEEGAFNGLYSQATLYVPKGTVEIYRKTAGWNLFMNIVELNEVEPENCEPYAVYKDGVLTFYYDDKKGTREGMVYELNKGYSDPGWYTAHRTDITMAVFDNSFAGARPTSTYRWFAVEYNETSSLTEIQGIQNLNTSNVTNMETMFYGCSSLTSLDVSHFDTSNVTSMYYMFSGCSSLTSLDVSHFDTGNVTYMSSMFSACSSLTSLDVSHFDTSNVPSMYFMFSGCSSLASLDVSHFDTGNVKDMGFMFSGCSSLTSLDVSHFITSNVTNMNCMFKGCSGLTSLDVGHFDTGNVTNMGSMFFGCSGLTSLDVSHFDTSNVTSMNALFNGCSGLTSLDVSHFDTENVTNMVSMFSGCNSLTSLDVSHFDTGNITNMGSMFFGCSGLTSLDVSHFDTDNVTTMSLMFASCGGLTSLDLSHFNTSKVTNISMMFSNSINLSTIYCNDIWTCSSSSGMFYNCKSLLGYQSAHTNVDYAKPIDLGGYFTRTENNPNSIIDFADAEVKRICVENWDTNGDGELSFGESAAVADLGNAFSSSKITSFDELQFFSGLSVIGEGAFNNSTINHLVLPLGLKTICRSAFNNCSELKTMDFPSSLQEIENSAFFYGGLTHIVIPKTIVKIGSEPFFACPIESITVDSENPYYDSRDNCHALIETASNRLIVGTVDAFIPNTVTIIGGGAFYGNPNRSRTSLEIPSSVVQIDRCILRGNTGMTSLHIPASVRIIDRKAFDGVQNLSTITVDSENKYYDSRNNCNAIIETATNTLIRGSIDATIPESVEKIESCAFYENNLTSVMIPEGVKSIGYESFAFCYKLKSIDVPNSVTSIGSYAFSYSPYLEIIKVHIKEPFALSEKCFSGFYDYSVKENATLYVPYGTKSLYEQTNGWKDFKNIIEMDGENYLYTNDVTVRPGNKKTIILQLDNENTFIAGEFRLQLPEGIRMETDEDGDPIANLVSERINKHTLMVTDEGNGLYHFMFYSGQNRAILGNSGDFITLSVIADEELEEGSYIAELKNVIFSTEDEKQINLPDITFNINVLDYTPADVNGDGSLNVMDVVKLVNYIMGRNPSDFVFAASDMDENGKINVMDLVNAVEVIMAAPQYVPINHSSISKLSGLKLDRTEKNTISLNVPDADKHIAAQFIVTLSGKSVLKDALSDATHKSEITRMADGRYKVMVYSGKNDVFRNDSPISLQLSDDSDVMIEDVVFVDTTEEPTIYESANTNTTGIKSTVFEFSQPTDIYTVSGKLVKKNAISTIGLAKGIYVVNNEKVIIK